MQFRAAHEKPNKAGNQLIQSVAISCPIVGGFAGSRPIKGMRLREESGRTVTVIQEQTQNAVLSQPASQREVAAVIEHVLADRPGDWRVSIVGFPARVLHLHRHCHTESLRHRLGSILIVRSFVKGELR
jgi:nitrogen regulatory protein PII-like uncharacterized protein